jgi:hypothetical protein
MGASLRSNSAKGHKKIQRGHNNLRFVYAHSQRALLRCTMLPPIILVTWR